MSYYKGLPDFEETRQQYSNRMLRNYQRAVPNASFEDLLFTLRIAGTDFDQQQQAVA